MFFGPSILAILWLVYQLIKEALGFLFGNWSK